ncbi:hypothetical protein AGDE_10493 [Angomonas deanei]|nr:hypothetical protein AGDE_10493 [Angomonas deanei]|eukprot:EPY28215.1 hypothetical protein AGDE_10493 [Angomonas deanei]
MYIHFFFRYHFSKKRTHTHIKKKKMKVVRRARKSLRERRMTECINDLAANLSKVEMKVYRKQRETRLQRRKRLGLAGAVPADILAGKMNPSLYEVECRLHEEAGLPRPRPYPGYASDVAATRAKVQRVGFVSFQTLLNVIRERKNRH